MGRHLTAYLVTNDLCSKVRVVDKVPPVTGWLNKEHMVGPSAHATCCYTTCCVRIRSKPVATEHVVLVR